MALKADHESVYSITQSCNRRSSDDTSQFKFRALEHKQIEVTLSNLDSNKSTGHDLIPPKILKTASRELSHLLADLYNRCIESCDWPLHWKKGDWVPVFKKDNKQDIKNYRPVTVLTVIGKVFEQLLSKQLTSFIDSKLSHNLTAYRRGVARIFQRGVTVCQNEGTHQIVMSFSPPVVGCLLKKSSQKGGSQAP